MRWGDDYNTCWHELSRGLEVILQHHLWNALTLTHILGRSYTNMHEYYANITILCTIVCNYSEIWMNITWLFWENFWHQIPNCRFRTSISILSCLLIDPTRNHVQKMHQSLINTITVTARNKTKTSAPLKQYIHSIQGNRNSRDAPLQPTLASYIYTNAMAIDREQVHEFGSCSVQWDNHMTLPWSIRSEVSPFGNTKCSRKLTAGSGFSLQQIKATAIFTSHDNDDIFRRNSACSVWIQVHWTVFTWLSSVLSLFLDLVIVSWALPTVSSFPFSSPDSRLWSAQGCWVFSSSLRYQSASIKSQNSRPRDSTKARKANAFKSSNWVRILQYLILQVSDFSHDKSCFLHRFYQHVEVLCSKVTHEKLWNKIFNLCLRLLWLSQCKMHTNLV